jgi:ABC-type bacteriocin/lantibiotic exporter with double-glycine peptidase domain
MAYQNNLEQIVEKLNLNVRKEAIKKSFKLLPDYPSLSALSDVLSDWRVDNLAVKISPQQLQEVTLPAIAHCEDGREGYFVLLQSFDNQKVSYYDSEKGAITESIELFTAKWHGVTLLMDISAKSGEVNYQEKR